MAKRKVAWLGACSRVLHAFWLKGGPMPPLGFAKGGHFEVKDGHPDFLQIT